MSDDDVQPMTEAEIEARAQEIFTALGGHYPFHIIRSLIERGEIK